jgi:hypothetical protein
MAGYTFSGDAVQRIRQTVRTVEGQQEMPQASRANSIALQFDYGIYGVTDVAIGKGTSGIISVYTKPRHMGGVDTGDNITGITSFGSIPANREVYVVTTDFGFLIIGAECA